MKHADIKAMRAGGKSFAAIGRHYKLDRNGTKAMTTAFNNGLDYTPRGGKCKPTTGDILQIEGGIDLYMLINRKLSGLCPAYGLSFNDASFLNACDKARDKLLQLTAAKLASHPKPLAYAFLMARSAATDSLRSYERINVSDMGAMPEGMEGGVA